METKDNTLLLGGIKAEDLIRTYGSPLYVYEEEILKNRVHDLVSNISCKRLRIHYACKANSNPEILKTLKKAGCKIETVSPGEVELALKVGFKPSEILFTCGNLAEAELRFLVEKKIMINVDSLGQLEKIGELAAGSRVSIRVNQGIGAGHHSHVITGGPESKFGIWHTYLRQAQAIAEKFELKIVGVHQHIGSGILDESMFLKAMKALLKSARSFKDLEFVDFGGGFGVPYRPEEKPLDMKSLGQKIAALFADFCEHYGKKLDLVFEPGRYLICEAGTLLATVTDIKRNPARTFVGVDSGLNQLIRPAMYGAYHEIQNASQMKGATETVTVVGNICESGDVFAKDRNIVKFKEGDILAIRNAGAYGFSMSSNYNSRTRPMEIMVAKGKSRVIREREEDRN